MSEHQLTVEVTVVPKAVELQEENVYLFRGGKLLDCGQVSCITGHLDDLTKRGVATYSDLMAVWDHFDGSGMYAQDGPHVIQAGEA